MKSCDIQKQQRMLFRSKSLERANKKHFAMFFSVLSFFQLYSVLDSPLNFVRKNWNKFGRININANFFIKFCDRVKGSLVLRGTFLLRRAICSRSKILLWGTTGFHDLQSISDEKLSLSYRFLPALFWSLNPYLRSTQNSKYLFVNAQSSWNN